MSTVYELSLLQGDLFVRHTRVAHAWRMLRQFLALYAIRAYSRLCMRHRGGMAAPNTLGDPYLFGSSVNRNCACTWGPTQPLSSK